MKKQFVFFVMIFLFVSLLLCGCAPEDEPISEQPSEESKQSQNEGDSFDDDYYENLIFSENGKFGVRKADGSSLVPAEYDDVSYGFLGTRGFYVLTKENDGAESYEVVLTNGELVTSSPADGIYAFEYVLDSPITVLYTTESGVRRTYVICEGNEDAPMIDVNFPYLKPQPQNGWFLLRSFSEGRRANYGIVDSDGNVAVEPEYIYAEVPFADRFILCKGDSVQSAECFECNLTDSTGKVLNNSFNFINYTVFDDGSYIGVARSEGKLAEVVCYTDGEPTPKGYWFVDKDGKILSERFDYISVYAAKDYETQKSDPVIVESGDESDEYSAKEILKKYYE